MAIYTDDLANRLLPRAGESWRPSNGFEGDLFTERVCHQCEKCDADGTGCTISMMAFFASKGDPDYPSEWIIGPDGQPKCTAFAARKSDAEGEG